MPTYGTEGLTLAVDFRGHNAWGRARYDVRLTRDSDDAVLFESDALELPWQDDRRALADAAGFLSFYATDGNPEEHTGVTREQLATLEQYADALSVLDSDLTGAYEGWED